MFYRGQMLARNAANAVFPCGSGVVWRRRALRDINNFPTWNLVEDLQSGVEALRRGWRGLYLPIVGAVGQHAPEDLPNTYKQRGTWAIDGVRLILWGELRGLNLRQRLQFCELLMVYLYAFTVAIYIPVMAAALVGHGPLVATGADMALHVVPAVLAAELWLLVAFYPYNDRRLHQRRYLRSLWRARAMWVGMAPIYIVGVIKAVLGGPHRKPRYQVTRKTTDARWHWPFVLPHAAWLGLLGAALVQAIGQDSLPSVGVLAPVIYWGGLNTVLLIVFISRSWHGVSRPRRPAQIDRVAGPTGGELGPPQREPVLN
jgi:cellulose synthase (UDP-forming)